MRKRKRIGEEERALRFGIMVGVVILIIVIIIVVVRTIHMRVDTAEGEKRLKAMEKADVQEIDAKIHELEKIERQSSIEWQNSSYNEKFTDCLVLGDSISQGLYMYQHLDDSLVNAQKGVGVVHPDDTGFWGIVDQVISASPQKLFIALGMNDTISADADAKVFAEAYKAVLDRLKEGLPNTQIYVNSILPVTQVALQKDARFACVPDFNERLKELCESEETVFIDNTGLVKDEYYEADGIHMSSNYYPEWLDHMAEVADL